MTLGRIAIAVAVVFGCSVWSWCRPCVQQAQAQGQPVGPEMIYAASDPGIGQGGNHDEAAYRYRTSQCSHWRQVALGRNGCR